VTGAIAVTSGGEICATCRPSLLLDRQGARSDMLDARTEPSLLREVPDTTSPIPSAVVPCAPAPLGRLSIVYPHALAAAFAIAERPFVVGRQGDGTVLHPTVSRAHAAIAWCAEAGAHLVRDLDSHNGSVLDGVPLGRQPRPLRDGSVLRLGNVLAVWEHSPAAAAPAGVAADTTLDGARDAPLDLPSRARPPVPSRDEFIAAFEQLGGSVRALARHFARDRRQIYRWIDAHGIADRR
jgi:hypothetical protein